MHASKHSRGQQDARFCMFAASPAIIAPDEIRKREKFCERLHQVSTMQGQHKTPQTHLPGHRPLPRIVRHGHVLDVEEDGERLLRGYRCLLHLPLACLLHLTLLLDVPLLLDAHVSQ